MSKLIITERPDPAWRVAVQMRTAVLWLGPDLADALPEDNLQDILARWILCPWAFVYVDAANLPIGRLKQEHQGRSSHVLRVYDNDAGPETIPPNRLPVFCLRGPDGSITPAKVSDPRGLLIRYRMLERAPSDARVFALGVSSPIAIQGLQEAQGVSDAFRRLLVVDTSNPDLGPLEDKAESLVLWRADASGFDQILPEVRVALGAPAPLEVLVQSGTGTKPVDLQSCIDPSHPITASFDVISAADVLAEAGANDDAVAAFMADPTASWGPYASSIPFPRHRGYRDALQRQLNRFISDGPSASLTAWLDAQEGSGATVALRSICFETARRGYPVLIAKPEVEGFDFQQLSWFLTRASDTLSSQGVSVPELPWVVAFDAQHIVTNWEFLLGLCSGLKKLMRSVIVLCVRNEGMRLGEGSRSAAGHNCLLGQTLTNTVTLEEALSLGEHFARFLSPHRRRSRKEWERFIGDTLRPRLHGGGSLFWIALRFWLFRLPDVEEPLRAWLSARIHSLCERNPDAYAGVLETAAFSRHRLPIPLSLLGEAGAEAVRKIAADPGNPLGLRSWQLAQRSAVYFSHPLVAEELLRLATEDGPMLSAIGKATCMNYMDLELHVLGRLIGRETAGRPECVPLIEELVVSGLRVDPRESPRNYPYRDRIVSMLERAPDSLWDASQVFNHHVAKARRHLAIDPPSSAWSEADRREQLELAENHLVDALRNIRPSDESRRESDLNLYVSLALTYDARARLELGAGEDAVVAEYASKAEASYRAGQQLDPDNPYVLENYARSKIRTARNAPPSSERVTLLVDAIAMLEIERDSDQASDREEPVLVELASAYELLEANQGRAMLLELIQRGNEGAAVALAKLALRPEEAGEVDPERLREAEHWLTQVSADRASWRSRYALYRVVRRSRPLAFTRRLELLDELDADAQYPWPLQTRLEYAILLFQAGDQASRHKGKGLFREIRDVLPDRKAPVSVPSELRFLADPASGYRDRLVTTAIVKNISNVGRSSYAIPDGWGNVDVAFRAYRFGRDVIRPRDELDCFIQFTNFGPQAVPLTTD